jgi:sugar O-acyltransferase (sialic acid O-acetyltransferase NeuD family)
VPQITSSSSTPNRLAVIGFKGHARVVSEAAQAAGFDVIGFVVEKHIEKDAPSCPDFRGLSEIDLDYVGLALGIGLNFLRENVYERIAAEFPHAVFPAIVHPTAFVSPSAKIGAGSVLLPHSSVGSGSYVGVGALLNTGSSLDHNSTLSAFASLGPGARTGGDVAVGERSMIGLNSGVLQGRHVGTDTVVGAHSLVFNDLGNLVVAYGTPAKKIRSRLKNDPYL